MPQEIYTQNIPIHWTSCWSISNEENVLIPTSYCYTNTPFSDNRYIRWSSNGCAAGNNIEEAILQGMYELIERDAVSIWWYNRLRRPEIKMDQRVLAKLAVSKEFTKEWHTWLLDLTNDLNIPVVAAVAVHRIKRKYALGFGSHNDRLIAGERAITEMIQLINVNRSIDMIDDPDYEYDYLYPDESVAVRRSVKNVYNHGVDLAEHIQYCVEQCRNSGLDVIVLDYERKVLPLKVVKVVVPGLCHIWPQFAMRRLYQVPVLMGWLTKKRKEIELNPIPLFV